MIRILAKCTSRATNLVYGPVEWICAEDVSSSPLTKVSSGFWGRVSFPAVIRVHFTVCVYLLCVVLVEIQQASQPILHPCCMETLLSACTTPAPPLRTTCGTYLDGCVSLCFEGTQTPGALISEPFCVCLSFLPAGINPSLWDKEDVALWLHWAQREYSLRRPEKGRFEMNGRALCLLTKEDFRRRCPSSGKRACTSPRRCDVPSFLVFCVVQVMFCTRFCSA